MGKSLNGETILHPSARETPFQNEFNDNHKRHYFCAACKFLFDSETKFNSGTDGLVFAPLNKKTELKKWWIIV
jgi:peptide methionine sulfoxide reductase MsrB